MTWTPLSSMSPSRWKWCISKKPSFLPAKRPSSTTAASALMPPARGWCTAAAGWARAAGSAQAWAKACRFLPRPQQHLQPADDHLHRHAVVAAAGDDDVGVALAGFDELQVHGPHGIEVLLDDGVEGTAAVVHVALQSADEAVVFYSPQTLEIKKMEPISPDVIREAFGRDDLFVFTEREALETYLKEQNWFQTNLLWMSSGTFGGISFDSFSQELLNQPYQEVYPEPKITKAKSSGPWGGLLKQVFKK